MTELTDDAQLLKRQAAEEGDAEIIRSGVHEMMRMAKLQGFQLGGPDGIGSGPIAVKTLGQ